jgi:hypothetical protein
MATAKPAARERWPLSEGYARTGVVAAPSAAAMSQSLRIAALLQD